MANLIYIAGDVVRAYSSSQTKLTVNDSGITVYTLTAGMTGCILQNSGTGICWAGGETDVSATNKKGTELVPKDSLVNRNCSPGFKAGFRCATGVTTEISILEY